MPRPSLLASLMLLLATGCGGDKGGSEDPRSIEICDDGEDNDLDGYADCDDDECTSSSACNEVCGNGVDDDANGLVDCLDPFCFGALCAEVCDDNGDNDLDGRVDCDDTDCTEACGTTADTDTDVDSDTDVDTDTDTDVDTDVDTDTDTDPTVDTSDTGLLTGFDGTYVGTMLLDIYYGPIIIDTCFGSVTIEVDETAMTPITSYANAISCTVVPYGGTSDITGDITVAPDAAGSVTVDVPTVGSTTDNWVGAFGVDRIDGMFSGTLAGFDYDGTFNGVR